MTPLAAVASDGAAEQAALAKAILDPTLTLFTGLFLVRIVLSWYPQLLNRMPFKALALPVEPFLRLLRGVVEPIGGVDITPIIWLATCSFFREILLGPQGILTLIATQRMA